MDGSSLPNTICGRDGGDWDGMLAELECVGDAFTTGVGH